MKVILPIFLAAVVGILLRINVNKYWRQKNVSKIKTIPAKLVGVKTRKWFGTTYYVGTYVYQIPGGSRKYPQRTKSRPEQTIGVKCLRPTLKYTKRDLVRLQNWSIVLFCVVLAVIFYLVIR